MKLQELRVGNLVCIDDLPPERVTLDLLSALREAPATISKFKGVPLTTKMLLGYGFDVNFYGDYKMGEISLMSGHKEFWFFHNKLECKIEYVHQLQNLVFVLLGVEIDATREEP